MGGCLARNKPFLYEMVNAVRDLMGKPIPNFTNPMPRESPKLCWRKKIASGIRWISA